MCRFNKDSVKSCGVFMVISNYFEKVMRFVQKWVDCNFNFLLDYNTILEEEDMEKYAYNCMRHVLINIIEGEMLDMKL